MARRGPNTDNHRSSRDNTQNDLGNLSRALSDVAISLNKTSKLFEQTSRSLDRSTGTSSDKFTKASDGITSFGKDFDRILARSDKNTKGNLSNFQTITKGLIGTFEVVGKMFVSHFTRASDRIISDYNSSLTDITVRMQQSNREYTKMLNESTRWIREHDLKTQFSQIDFTRTLTDILATGLRDGDSLASSTSEIAYRNMISNKLLPQLSTNTKAYTKLAKTFGDQFQEATIAVGKYTEKIYGAEGLEENQINDLLQSTYREILTAVREQGGGVEDFNRIWSGTVTTYQEIASRYGSEASATLLSDYVDAITDTVSRDNILALIGARDSGIAGGDLSRMSESTFSDFVGAEIEFMRSYDSSAAINAMTSQAGIGHGPTWKDILNYDVFGSDVMSSSIAMSLFDPTEVYKGNLEDLSKGMYQSITAQQDKWNENTVARTSNVIAEYIPNSSETLSSLFKIVNIWFTSWMAYNTMSKAKDLINSGGLDKLYQGGGDGFLARTFLKTGGESGVLMNGTGKGLLGGLTTKSGASVGSMMTSTAGLATSGLLGGALVINDAYKGYKDDGWQGSIKGALTGVTGSMDSFKDVLWAGAKNTVKGAAIGNLLGGPLGAAIGGSAGALLGLTTAVVDYTDKQNVLGRSLNSLKENSDQLNQSLLVQRDNYKESQSLHKLSSEALSGNESAVQELNRQYPILSTKLDETGRTTDAYEKTLNNLLALENRKLAKESLESKSSVYKEAGIHGSGFHPFKGTTTSNLTTALKGIEDYYNSETITPEMSTRYSTAVESYQRLTSLIDPSLYEMIIKGLPYTLSDIQGNKKTLESDAGTLLLLSQLNSKYPEEVGKILGTSYDDYVGSFGEYTPRSLYNLATDLGVNFSNIPPFKHGSIRHHGTGLGIFHDNELTLRSADADKLRELAEGEGITSFLTSALHLSRTSTLPSDTTSSMRDYVELVTHAINDQTDKLSSLIVSIYEVLVRPGPSSSHVDIENSVIVERMRNFEGI